MPTLVHELWRRGPPSESSGLALSLPTRPASSRNEHVIVRNLRGGAADKRRLMIGRTDGGRALTLVIEQTIEPTTWLIVTGWSSTDAERNRLEGSYE